MTRFATWFLPVVLACSFLSPVTLSAPSRPELHTLTPNGLSVLKNAGEVQPFRVSGLGASETPDLGKTIDGYAITAKGKRQGKAYTQRLVSAILTALTYSGYQDMCIFNPAITFEFHDKTETVTAVLCFHCGDMAITERDASGKLIHHTYTKFTPARQQLLKLAQEAFPDDAELKALK